MTSTRTNRLGQAPGSGAKEPCRVATNANITLTGLQTIDDVALATGDRVLVRSQTNAAENGIYTASNGTWTRTPDWNRADDAVPGVFISVSEGTLYRQIIFIAQFVGPLVIDTTPVQFGFRIGVVDSIVELAAIGDLLDQDSDARTVHLKGFYSGSILGGGKYSWSPTTDKADANGGSIIDPDTLGGFDGTTSTVYDYLSAQGTGVGSGCWVAVQRDSWNPEMWGHDESLNAGVFVQVMFASAYVGDEWVQSKFKFLPDRVYTWSTYTGDADCYGDVHVVAYGATLQETTDTSVSNYRLFGLRDRGRFRYTIKWEGGTFNGNQQSRKYPPSLFGDYTNSPVNGAVWTAQDDADFAIGNNGLIRFNRWANAELTNFHAQDLVQDLAVFLSCRTSLVENWTHKNSLPLVFAEMAAAGQDSKETNVIKFQNFPDGEGDADELLLDAIRNQSGFVATVRNFIISQCAIGLFYRTNNKTEEPQGKWTVENGLIYGAARGAIFEEIAADASYSNVICIGEYKPFHPFRGSDSGEIQTSNGNRTLNAENVRVYNGNFRAGASASESISQRFKGCYVRTTSERSYVEITTASIVGTFEQGSLLGDSATLTDSAGNTATLIYNAGDNGGLTRLYLQDVSGAFVAGTVTSSGGATGTQAANDNFVIYDEYAIEGSQTSVVEDCNVVATGRGVFAGEVKGSSEITTLAFIPGENPQATRTSTVNGNVTFGRDRLDYETVTFTATQGQTAFDTGYTDVNRVYDVFRAVPFDVDNPRTMGGTPILVQDSDYSFSTGTGVLTMDNPASTGDIIMIEVVREKTYTETATAAQDTFNSGDTSYTETLSVELDGSPVTYTVSRNSSNEWVVTLDTPAVGGESFEWVYLPDRAKQHGVVQGLARSKPNYFSGWRALNFGGFVFDQPEIRINNGYSEGCYQSFCTIQDDTETLMVDNVTVKDTELNAFYSEFAADPADTFKTFQLGDNFLIENFGRDNSIAETQRRAFANNGGQGFEVVELFKMGGGRFKVNKPGYNDVSPYRVRNTVEQILINNPTQRGFTEDFGTDEYGQSYRSEDFGVVAKAARGVISKTQDITVSTATTVASVGNELEANGYYHIAVDDVSSNNVGTAGFVKVHNDGTIRLGTADYTQNSSFSISGSDLQYTCTAGGGDHYVYIRRFYGSG